MPVMSATDQGGRGPDHYQLLGVPREASREDIAQAWRRRARKEHPDARPYDADAPGRFRALAEAWQVLGDPARRATYDRALDRAPQRAARVHITVLPVSGDLGGITPGLRVPAPPLRAGPVQVDSPPGAQARPVRDERDITLAVLAELAVRGLARGRSRPW
jgi:DnaJ domain